MEGQGGQLFLHSISPWRTSRARQINSDSSLFKGFVLFSLDQFECSSFQLFAIFMAGKSVQGSNVSATTYTDTIQGKYNYYWDFVEKSYLHAGPLAGWLHCPLTTVKLIFGRRISCPVAKIRIERTSPGTPTRLMPLAVASLPALPPLIYENSS